MSFGRLERKQHSTPMSEINMTPLIDVMLVLLVIFILTTPLLMGSVKINLPKAQVTSNAPPPAALSVVVDAAGQVFVADQLQSADAFAATLQRIASANPQTEVQLRADAGVLYGRVVEVMGAIQKAGLYRIGFVAVPAPAAVVQN
jgi:biopolymer transport protein TolR